jgi:hypothetical protein
MKSKRSMENCCVIIAAGKRAELKLARKGWVRTQACLQLERAATVPESGFEPPTYGLGNRCSIHLSYPGNTVNI